MTRQISGQTLDRRKFMVGAGTVALVISGAAVMHPGEAWGLEVKNLKPETMRTLIKTRRATSIRTTGWPTGSTRSP